MEILRKPLVKCLLFLIFLYALLFFTEQIFNANSKKQKTKFNWMLSKMNNNDDIAFLGNSRVLNNVDANLISSLTGKKILNLGFSGTEYSELYLILSLYLKNNNLKKLFIEVNPSMLIEPDSAFSFPFHYYHYLPMVNTNPLVSEVIKDKIHNDLYFYCWKYIPMIKYAEYNQIAGWQFFFNKFLNMEPFDSGGFEGISITEADKFVPTVGNKFVADKRTISYLEKIIEVARTQRTELVLFSAPLNKNAQFTEDFQTKYQSVISEVCAKNKIRYINFEKTYFSDRDSCFKDRSHLNTKGTKLFAQMLSDTILN